MKNRYLINNGYYTQYIREDIASLLFYYDHFSQGISLPKYFSHIFTRRIIHAVLRILIIMMFVSRLYKIRYKTIILEDDAIIINKGRGTWGNIIKLVKDNEQYKILKKVSSKEVYLREKAFYNNYKDSTTKIKFPKHVFHKNNVIEIEFIHTKSLQRLITEGTYDLHDTIKHYNQIKNELKLLYRHDPVLVHGDLFFQNIFIVGNNYYLIDFSDAHINSSRYDLYVLLYSLVLSFNYASNNTKTIANVLIKNTKMHSYAGISKEEFLKIEKKYHTFIEKKIPGTYSP